MCSAFSGNSTTNCFISIYALSFLISNVLLLIGKTADRTSHPIFFTQIQDSGCTMTHWVFCQGTGQQCVLCSVLKTPNTLSFLSRLRCLTFLFILIDLTDNSSYSDLCYSNQCIVYTVHSEYILQAYSVYVFICHVNAVLCTVKKIILSKKKKNARVKTC